MPEKSPSTPDLEYAKQLRIGGVAPAEHGLPVVRYSLDTDKIRSSDEEPLSSDTRSQLDFIVHATGMLSSQREHIDGIDAGLNNALAAGMIYAGENRTGQKNGTEMGYYTPEEFRAMVARAVGEQALKAYETELIGDTATSLDEITVPRLISTVTNVESSGSVAPVTEPGELRSTFKPASAVEGPEDAASTPGKLISTFDNPRTPAGETEDDAGVVVEPAPEVPEQNLESDVDDMVEFAESRPLEPRAEPEVATVIEAEPTEPEREKPQITLAEVMKTPESLMSALSDTELDPAVKIQLRQVVGSWNRLQTAKVAEEVWDEVVNPQLRRLDETLPNFANTAKHVAEELDTLESGLTQLATAVEYGDLERMGSLNRRYRFIENFGETARKSRQLASDENIGKVSRSLDLQLLESDDRIKRIMRKDTTDFTIKDADALCNTPGVTDARTLDDVQAALLAADQSGALRKLAQRKDAIQAMIQFGRSTDRVLNQTSIQGAARTVENMLQDLFAQRSRMTSSDVHMIRGKLKRDLVDPIEQLHKLGRLTQMYKDEVKR